ncbi:efflux RND transporter periplasmic adaptor subunit [Paracoccus sp. (in: a-proteobacteria)]|uniref:efflux RND transporter periplasmic adaptor subunit n=1 Tax=Paracoccus sp. TaxID=267 RepID=UPI003A8975AD
MRFLIVFVAFGLAITACRAGAEDLRVEFVTAGVRPLNLDLALSGTIEAWDSVELGFRQSGRVVEVLVDEGDRVAPGQAMARLDPVQQDQALKVAAASLVAARVVEAQARQASQRADAMLARGVGTRAARDDARRGLADAEGAVRRAESGVDQAQRALEETVLRAPGAAVVTRRDMAPGMIVGPAQPVVALASVDGLEAVFNSPDHPLLDNAMGAGVQLDTLDIDTPQMTGTVTEIAPLVDPVTGTVTVRARIDSATEGGIRLLGAAVRGRLRIRSDSGVVIPWAALTRQGENPAVWIVGKDNRVALAPVEIMYFADGEVYLSGGIDEGQTVVGAGSQQLFAGRMVQPVGVAP